MHKIAFLRSVDIQRADPYIQRAVRELSDDGIESRLFYTHGRCGPADFPAGGEPLDPAVTPLELADAVSAWGADAAVSVSLPCENALRDATAKAFLDARGIPTVMTPLAATWLLCDKWETKQALIAAGLDVARGIRADSDLTAGRGLPVPAYRQSLLVAAGEIGYPLLSKPLWDSTSMGIRFLPDRAALDAYLADPPPVSAVLEECLTGDLCSVDIVGAPGNYSVLPLCWTGQAGGGAAFTFADLRWCGPRPQADADFAPVAERLVALSESLGVYGSVNVDMIHVNGRYVVLEINPRIGGATTLSCAASGTNTFAALADMARGRYPDAARPDTRRKRWAIEFLADRPVGQAADELRDRLGLVTAHELVIDGNSHGDIVTFTCEEGDEQRTVKELDTINSHSGILAPVMMDKVRTLLCGP
ncbi:acetyl-CoA carboxylase biotin carboxylase subunit family protein [Streptomyces fildesensis]|uniref:Acetyl-CoA carboxylase biotin carboxylase subunit family protein n=1 Tax=Streptomyces fildesensis TaxID=375757 RepID=A0ABW8C5P6_9ACTN